MVRLSRELPLFALREVIVHGADIGSSVVIMGIEFWVEEMN